MQEENKEYFEIISDKYLCIIVFKGLYYHQSKNSTQEPKSASLDKFLLRRQGKKWDNVPVLYFGFDDLDPFAFKFFREKDSKKKRVYAEFLEEIDYIIVRDSQKYVTESIIKIEYFKSNSNLAYQNAIEGSLLEQTIVYKSWNSQQIIQTNVYDDKLFMCNSIDLPQDWTIDTLIQKHNPELHNPYTVALLSLTDYVEYLERGIEKIIEESQKFNSITPQFRWGNGLWVEFYFNNFPKKVENTETGVKIWSLLVLIQILQIKN